MPETIHHELVNGNYYPICDSSDDLHVTACLLYCRANWISSRECVKQNNIPICKYRTEIELTTTTSAPFGSLLLI